MKRGFKAWADRKSLEIRDSIGLKYYDPINCYDLSEKLCVPIFTIMDLKPIGLDNRDINRLVSNGNSSISACAIKTKYGTIMIINHSHSVNRINSDIAHELSHIICEHEFFPLPTNGELLVREFSKDCEDEANWLSSCILIPRDGLVWAVNKKMDITDIAAHFHASESMTRWRYNITGVGKQMKWF